MRRGPTHLKCNWRVVIHQRVPLSTDILLRLIPWLWKLNARLKRRRVEPPHREHGRRVIKKVPVRRVAPPPDTVVRRCQGRCDRREDAIDRFLRTGFKGSGVPVGHSPCSERFSLAVELKNLRYRIRWSSFCPTHNPLEAWNCWLPRLCHSIEVLLATVKEVQLQLQLGKTNEVLTCRQDSR